MKAAESHMKSKKYQQSAATTSGDMLTPITRKTSSDSIATFQQQVCVAARNKKGRNAAGSLHDESKITTSDWTYMNCLAFLPNHFFTLCWSFKLYLLSAINLSLESVQKTPHINQMPVEPASQI